MVVMGGQEWLCRQWKVVGEFGVGSRNVWESDLFGLIPNFVPEVMYLKTCYV